MSIETIKAPWTKEQVEALSRYQQSNHFHPYTCGTERCRQILVATETGWKCPVCNYTQDWAHAGTIGSFLAVEKARKEAGLS